MPDTSFIPPRTFRRLSRMSRMALYTAHHASRAVTEDKIGPPIFCSNYGEFQHTIQVLNAVHDKTLVSPMDFSYSVHNTAQGLFSILNHDDRPATALAAREGGIEHAMVKACAQLEQGDDAVLVVYHEDVLPPPYQSDETSDIIPLSVGFVLQKATIRSQRVISLSFAPAEKEPRVNNLYSNAHEQDVMRLLARGAGEQSFNFNRLKWTWRCDGA